MTLLIHNYSNLANKTLHWDTTDNKDEYIKNTKNNYTRQRLIELGFLDTKIDYTYNSHGFRTAEFDQQFDVVCFGCSFTMGTGVHAQDTWPEQLALLTGLNVANLGHAGSSNDTAVRFAMHYLKLLQPKYAVWLQTDMHRIELIDDLIPSSLNIIAGDTMNPCANDYFIKTWFTSRSNQQLNLQKNTLSFEQLCKQLNIKSVIIPRGHTGNSLYPQGGARDLAHPGVDIYKKLAYQIKTIFNEPVSI
jgi:hypothetical protein